MLKRNLKNQLSRDNILLEPVIQIEIKLTSDKIIS
jgi:hypothetical protein